MFSNIKSHVSHRRHCAIINQNPITIPSWYITMMMSVEANLSLDNNVFRAYVLCVAALSLRMAFTSCYIAYMYRGILKRSLWCAKPWRWLKQLAIAMTIISVRMPLANLILAIAVLNTVQIPKTDHSIPNRTRNQWTSRSTVTNVVTQCPDWRFIFHG
jgi:hypothetical protein